jgi:fibronectin type 3 domain-containing protein
VRVLWDPVDAADLAGYVVFRAEDASPPKRMNDAPLTDPFFTDTTVQPGRRYRYTVRAIDRAGT